MKSVLISIQPYWVFLIIANKMGWNIDKEKTVEVRKNFPKDENWDKVVKIYCGKDKKSFNRIPKEYQPLMERFLGKIIGEFVCDEIKEIRADNLVAIYFNNPNENTCLNDLEMREYSNGKNLFLWHISNLKLYNEPLPLYFLRKPIDCHRGNDREACIGCWDCEITRLPQSWCYVESEGW